MVNEQMIMQWLNILKNKGPQAAHADLMKHKHLMTAAQLKQAQNVLMQYRNSGGPLTDAEGDGGVRFENGAGGYAKTGVGPDIGADVVDAQVPEGAFVLNAEAAELFKKAIDELVEKSGANQFNRGTRPMIPAKLTKGERVVAPHTSEMFRKQLEMINQKGLNARKMGYKCGGAVYRNTGGLANIIQNFLGAGQQEVPVDHAAAARNQTAGSALLGAGLEGAGQTSANQAGLITQAGLNNAAFTPQAGALDSVGRGIEAAGQAEAQYHSAQAEVSEEEKLISEQMVSLLRKANPHLAGNIQQRNNGGVIYRQDGTPPTDPINNFVGAFNQRDPIKMAEVAYESEMQIPAEIDALAESTKEISNLVATYRLYKADIISEEDWKHYIDVKWLGKKVEQGYNEIDYTRTWETQTGDKAYLIKKGPDSGKYLLAGTETVISKETHPDQFPLKQVTADSDDAAALYEETLAKKAADFSENMAEKVNAAQGIRRDANQAVEILERFPGVAGVFNVADADDSGSAIIKALGDLLQTGIATPWGQLAIDLSGFAKNLTLTDVEKDQLAKLEGLLSKLGTAARAELAGQGTITDAEADAVARQFGSIDNAASALIASLRLAVWRAELTLLQGSKWNEYENSSLAKNKAPRVNDFLFNVWAPVLDEEVAKIDVVSFGIVETTDTGEKQWNTENGDIKVGVKMVDMSDSSETYTVSAPIEGSTRKGKVKFDESGKEYDLHFGRPFGVPGQPEGNNWYLSLVQGYYFLKPVETVAKNEGGPVMSKEQMMRDKFRNGGKTNESTMANSKATLRASDTPVDTSMEISPGGGYAGSLGIYVAQFADKHNIDFTDYNLQKLEEMVKEADSDWGTLPNHEKEEWGNFDEFVEHYYNSGEYLNKGGKVGYKNIGGIFGTMPMKKKPMVKRKGIMRY